MSWIQLARKPDHVLVDMRHAARSLRRSAVGSVFIIVLFGTAIGVVSAYGTTLARLFRSHPIPEIESVAHLSRVRPGELFSMGDYEFIANSQRSFRELVAWTRAWEVIGASTAPAERVPGELVGRGYFEFLQGQPALGRVLQPDDHLPSAPPVVVLGYSVWRRLFHLDPSIVGKTIKVAGHRVEIVGVASPRLRGLAMPNVSPTAFWIPLRMLPVFRPELELDGSDYGVTKLTARLRSGVSLEQAAEELRHLAFARDQSEPLRTESASPKYRTTRTFQLVPASSIGFSELRDAEGIPLGYAVLGLVCLAFFCSAFSLGTFRTGQLATRADDRAIREALGVPKTRIVAAELWAGLFRTLCAAGVGVVVGHIFIATARATLMRWHGFTPDFPLQFDSLTIALLVLTAITGMILAEVVPVLVAPGKILSTRVTSSAPGTGRRWRKQRAIVAIQLFMAAFLLLAAAVCVQEVLRQGRRDTGLDLRRLAVVQLNFRRQQIQDWQARRDVSNILQRIQQLPQVENAAIASALPIGMTVSSFGSLTVPSRPFIRGIQDGLESILLVSSPEVFTTLGVTILRGRGFNSNDVPGADLVAVISASTAERLFGTSAAIGQRLVYRPQRWAGEVAHDQTYRIVGITEDTDVFWVGQRETSIIYLPFSQNSDRVYVIAARADRDPGSLVERMRQEVWRTNPELAVFGAGVGEDIADASNPVLESITVMLLPLAASGTALSLVALVGILIQAVAARKHEIAVRMALGAGRGRTIRDLVAAGLVPVVVGLTAAMCLFQAATILLRRVVYVGDLPVDLGTSIGVILGLVAISAAACYFPARQAADSDAMMSLRLGT